MTKLESGSADENPHKEVYENTLQNWKGVFTHNIGLQKSYRIAFICDPIFFTNILAVLHGN